MIVAVWLAGCEYFYNGLSHFLIHRQISLDLLTAPLHCLSVRKHWIVRSVREASLASLRFLIINETKCETFWLELDCISHAACSDQGQVELFVSRLREEYTICT